MAPKEDKSDNDSMNKLNFISNIGQTFWTVIVGAGVFFATMYSTQSVVNTRISYIEEEIHSLQQSDKKISDDLQNLSTKQNTILMDISNRLRDMEVKLTELQVRVLYALEAKDSAKKSQEAPK
jgi:hypothetical protein